MASVDGAAALVSAAVRAAILARAPRRTVSAVAAAAVSAIVVANAKAGTDSRSARLPAGTEREANPSHDDGVAGDPVALLASLRAVRSARRRRKKLQQKLRRQERRQQEEAAAAAPETTDQRGDPVAPAPVAQVRDQPRAEARLGDEGGGANRRSPPPTAPNGKAEPPDKKPRAEEDLERISQLSPMDLDRLSQLSAGTRSSAPSHTSNLAPGRGRAAVSSSARAQPYPSGR